MLLKSSCYLAVSLHGADYLLPFGQAVVDQKKAFRLSGSGRQLWERLSDAPSVDSLLESLIRDGEISPSDRQPVRKSIEDWTVQLLDSQLLREDPDTGRNMQPGSSAPEGAGCADLSFREPPTASLFIAGFSITLEGPRDFFSDEFRPFVRKQPGGQTADQRVTVTFALPRPHPGATVLLENEELCVLDERSVWRIVYPSSRVLRMARVSKDGSRAVIHLHPGAAEDKKQLQYELFHACRLLFLIRARRAHSYALHSASILYRGRAWLFSAPSGTGKSTHAAHWVKHGWAEILNGDLNLIAPSDDSFAVRGIPWCGTSGIAANKTVPLGGIILLRRSTDGRDAVLDLRPDEKQLKIMQRLITPSWTAEQLTDCLAFAGSVSDAVPVWTLSATKHSVSANVMKAAIDRFLDGQAGHST
jgi:hypothetical protein